MNIQQNIDCCKDFWLNNIFYHLKPGLKECSDRSLQQHNVDLDLLLVKHALWRGEGWDILGKDER